VTSKPAPAGSHRSLRGPALRFALLLALLAVGFVLARYTPLRDRLNVDQMRATLEQLRGLWWAPLAHVGLLLVFGSIGVPATPFLLAGAAIFGAKWGTVWNFAGVFAASCAGFGLARLLGREFVERIGGEKVKKAERIFHRRGFLPLVAVRFLPIPFQLVNAAAAVVGVRFPKFLFASAVGLLPPIAILTYFASALLGAATGERGEIFRQLALVSIACIIAVFLPVAIWRRRRIWRLARLRRERGPRAISRPEPPAPPDTGSASDSSA
jgi:uncharacterized membrane protein YdjX (TVP38/TMEM64 family)